MKKPIKRIIIAGGGSSGWMSAAMLSKQFPHMEIALVESPDVPIIGVGGIFNGIDATEKLVRGANLIQIYTGFVYEGPWIVKNILKDINYNS